MRARLWRLVACVAAALALLELGLQGVAFARWRTSMRQGARPVLCVGDSFTYGIGADPESTYPRHLDRLLRDAGRAAVVIQAGWPGRTSRDVLLGLPEQLHRHAPGRVLVQIGRNDPRRRPPLTEAPLAPARPGFPLRWRTGEQLAQVLAACGPGTPVEPLGFLGKWHDGEHDFWFEHDGRARVGQFELRWLLVHDRLHVLMPEGEEVELRWTRRQDSLCLDGDILTEPAELRAGPSPLAEARRALYEQRWADAVQGFGRCADDRSVEIAAREGLAIALARSGAAAAAAEQAAWLGQAQRARRERGLPESRPLAESLAHALRAIGDGEQALAVALAVAERWPESSRAWDVLMTEGVLGGRPDAVLALIERMLPAVARGSAQQHHLLHLRGQLLLGTDPRAALQSHLEAVLSGADEGFAQEQIAAAGRKLDAALLDACLAELGAGGAQAERLRQVFHAGTAKVEEVHAVLGAHLRSIVRLCRDAGAAVWLLTYPHEDPRLEAVVRAAAEDSGAGVVAISAEFVREIRSRPREQLLQNDGHCTAAGYALIAKAAAAAVLADR